MATSSSVPILGDVLFYTSGDTYNYRTDNRPLHNLDTNIRHLASSLVGIGYGEHASVDGSLLKVGRAVELLPTGLVRYPVDASLVTIVGLVVGSTEAGLNRVIWSSSHLDLDSVGLFNEILINSGGLIPEDATTLVTTCSTDPSQAGLVTVAVDPSANQVILGRIKSYPVVTIEHESTTQQNLAFTSAQQVIANHHNLYGFNRYRNLLLALDMGQTPVQFTKTTFYQEDFSSTNINPMSALLNANKRTIHVHTDPSPAYDYNVMREKIIKEIYVPFTNGLFTADGSVNDSAWVTASYQPTIVENSVSFVNYELTPTKGSPDFSSSTSLLDQFKNFKIEKYYQYEKQSSTNIPLHGKLKATATVFNPDNTAWFSGEPSRMIIWDFYENSTSTGKEKVHHRIISTGAAANLFTQQDSGTGIYIFPPDLRNLV